jgi:hypothetical protein
MLLEKLPELFPELVEGVEWDVREGGFRNVLDFLASIRVTEFTQQTDDENLPLTHGVNWNEFGRNYRNFRLQEEEVDIFDLLSWWFRPHKRALFIEVRYASLLSIFCYLYIMKCIDLKPVANPLFHEMYRFEA